MVLIDSDILIYIGNKGLEIPDALIAATALTLKIPLLTMNRKDFRFIEKIELLDI